MRRGVLVSVAILTSVLAAACDAQEPPPQMKGTLVALSGGALWQLRAGTGDRLQSTRIAGGPDAEVVGASISPDHRLLAYLTTPLAAVAQPEQHPYATRLVLRDLRAGRERTLVRELPTMGSPNMPVARSLEGCVAFSPSGRRLLTMGRAGPAAGARALIVLDLADPGGAPLVVGREAFMEEPHEPSGYGYAEVTCGRWLDDHRVAFDRRGAPPDRDERTWLPPDRTTVATLDRGAVELSDTMWRWSPVASCKGRHLLKARFHTREEEDHYLRDGVPADGQWVDVFDRVHPPEDAETEERAPGGLYTFEPSTCRAFVVGESSIYTIDRLASHSRMRESKRIDWHNRSYEPGSHGRPVWQPEDGTDTLAIPTVDGITLVDVSSGLLTDLAVSLPRHHGRLTLVDWAPAEPAAVRSPAAQPAVASSPPPTALSLAATTAQDRWHDGAGIDLCASAVVAPARRLASKVLARQPRAPEPGDRTTRATGSSCSFLMQTRDGRRMRVEVEARGHASTVDAETAYRAIPERAFAQESGADGWSGTAESGRIGDKIESFLRRGKQPGHGDVWEVLIHARSANLHGRVRLFLTRNERAEDLNRLVDVTHQILAATLAQVPVADPARSARTGAAGRKRPAAGGR
jgi:hypothetical protein